MDTDRDRNAAREAYERMSRKEKIRYIWSYYKVWFLIAALAIVLVIYGIWWRVNHPPVFTMVQAVFVNADSMQMDKSSFLSDFEKAQGYAEDETVSLEDNFVVNFNQADERSASSLQVLAAEFSAGDIDLFISEEDLFQREDEAGAFQSLSGLLSEDLLTQYQDSLYYSQDEEEKGEAVGIYLGNTQLVRDGVYSKDQKLVAGISSQAENPEEAAALLEFLLKTQE